MVKTDIKIPFITINLYYSTFLRNAEPDLDENSGGSTDLDQKIARSADFLTPYSPLSSRDDKGNFPFLISLCQLDKMGYRNDKSIESFAL